MENKGLSFYMNERNSVKKIIVDILSVNWPLSVNELHKITKEQLLSNISYQAVHKAVRQLYLNGCLEYISRKYCISQGWLREITSSIHFIKSNYGIDQKKPPKFGILIAKDDFIKSEMKKEEVATTLKKLIPIFQDAFERHNIFEKKRNEILRYLMEIQKKHEIAVLSLKGVVSGGAALTKEEDVARDKFQRWRIMHFACGKNVPKKDQLRFLQNIEERVRRKSYLVKLQCDMAETETKYIKLLEEADFKKEAIINSMFRPEEKVFIYTKML